MIRLVANQLTQTAKKNLLSKINYLLGQREKGLTGQVFKCNLGTNLKECYAQGQRLLCKIKFTT